MVIGRSLVVGCNSQIQWWVGRLVMGESVVGGSACKWVLKDRSVVDGLAVTVGGCVGCGGSGGGCGCVSILVVFFIFYFFYKVVLVDVGLCRWWLSALF